MILTEDMKAWLADHQEELKQSCCTKNTIDSREDTHSPLFFSDAGEEIDNIGKSSNCKCSPCKVGKTKGGRERLCSSKEN